MNLITYHQYIKNKIKKSKQQNCFSWKQEGRRNRNSLYYPDQLYLEGSVQAHSEDKQALYWGPY